LLISDVHFDSPHCDRRLLTKHLDQAKSVGAGIIVVGDWFDAMGSKVDKRAHKEGTRQEHQRDNYFDVLVDDAADYLTPYRDNLVLMSDGNHETAITRHHETNLLERLCKVLGVAHGGYSGWIRMMFGATGNRHTKRIYYHHGAGGGGPVTKGTINSHRRAASIDADIYLSGHIHESWYLENMMVKLNDNGRVTHTTQYHVQLPTYKQEHGSSGYHIEKERPAKPLGGWWLHLRHDGSQVGSVGLCFERAS
jgi:hypothetical protein